jgi:multiple antibiotic resistance protein MarB
MKLLSPRPRLAGVVSSQSMAEQTAQPATQNSRDAMIMPPAHDQSPSILTMGAGSDKSDELGVPYYNQRNLNFLPRNAGLF